MAILNIRKEDLIFERIEHEANDVDYLVKADITALIPNLPKCITNVSLTNTIYYVDGDPRDDKYLDRWLNEISSSKIEEGYLYNPENDIIVTLEGGLKIRAWNSEWGGIELIQD